MSDTSNTHWARQRETTFVAGIWLLYGVYRLTGRWVFRVCMAPVVLVHWLAHPALRQASLQYLQRLHAAHGVFAKPPGAWQSLRHVALFADTMLDKLLVVGGRYAAGNVQEHGYEPVRRARHSGQGGIFVTAHMGCLELCRLMSAHESTFKLNVLVHTQHAQAFNRILQRLNPQAHVNLIEVTDMGVPMAMMLAEKVAAGEFIAIAGDRVPVRQSKTVTVDFLGHPAPLPVGPYVLASLLKCPLYLLGCVHEGRGYTVYFERLAERVELPRATRQAALQAHAQQFADAVAALLCRSPYDWFNFFPFWDQSHAE